MANTVIQPKYTTVSGRVPNNSTLVNIGEIATNITDGIMYVSNGSVIFEVGANNTTVRVSNSIFIGNSTANSIQNSTVHIISNTSYSTTIKPDFSETVLIVAASDEYSNLVANTAVLNFRAPFNMTLTKIPKATLTTNSTSGTVNCDIKVSGTSILGLNKLSIDASEATSTTAAVPTTLANSTITDDSPISVDIIGAGTGATGLKIYFYYKKT